MTPSSKANNTALEQLSVLMNPIYLQKDLFLWVYSDSKVQPNIYKPGSKSHSFSE